MKLLLQYIEGKNWDSLIYILDEIHTIARCMPTLQFTWILHPNPFIQSQIADYINSHPMAANLVFSEPLNHLEMATRIASSHF